MHDGSCRQINLGGWRRDKTDTRDFKLKLKVATIPGAPLPAAVDNSGWCSPVADQGNLGSCTAHAVTAAVEYNDRRFNVKPSKLRVSRLFTYYATRILEGDVGADDGASMRNAIKSLVTYGCIRESKWWYNIAKVFVNPSKKIWEAAATDKVASYRRIEDGDLTTIKTTLASGYLVCFGMAVFEAMLGAEVAASGIVPTPTTEDWPIGGHAVVIVGYDDAGRAVLSEKRCFCEKPIKVACVSQ